MDSKHNSVLEMVDKNSFDPNYQTIELDNKIIRLGTHLFSICTLHDTN